MRVPHGAPLQPVALKQRVLLSLTRLGDRDTQRVAVQELTEVIATISPDRVGVVVGCLCDDAAAAPKASARKEALRLFETLTGAQGEHALPHVPRMVSAIARRFKDPDSNVADACVDAMGSLAAFAVGCRPGGSRLVLGGDGDGQGKPVAAGPEALGRGVASQTECASVLERRVGSALSPGPLFVRPILDVIHETNSRAAQDTACRALARVFRRCGPGPGAADIPVGTNWYPDGGPERLALRLARMLEAQTFYAKPALLHAVAALFNAAAAAILPQLPAVLGVPGAVSSSGPSSVVGGAAESTAAPSSARLLDALRSADWPVRRAAAEALTVLMYALGPTLDTGPTPLVPVIESRLAEARFDKVKPARDAVGEALAVARQLRGYDGPQHDVVRWRTWVRHTVGDRVGAVGGDLGGDRGGGGGHLALGGASPKATRGHALGVGRWRARTPPPSRQSRDREGISGEGGVAGVAEGEGDEATANHSRGGSGRRALSEAFREAHVNGDAVLVPTWPPPPPAVRSRCMPSIAGHFPERPSELTASNRENEGQPHAGVSARSTAGCEGTTVDCQTAVEREEEQEQEQEQGQSVVDAGRRGEGGGRGVGAAGGGGISVDDFGDHDRVPPETARAYEGRLDDFPLDEEAPAWMSLAAQLETQLDAELERSHRRLGVGKEGKSDSGADVSAPTPGSGERQQQQQQQQQQHEQLQAAMQQGAPGTLWSNSQQQLQQLPRQTAAGAGAKEGGAGVVGQHAIQGAGGSSSSGMEGGGKAKGVWGDNADTDVRRQLSQLAVAQAQVLERLGAFVSESTAAIARLTQRVDALEGTVGAAVTSSAAAAASSVGCHARGEDGAEHDRRVVRALAAAADAAKTLAEDRVALEAEKTQLRQAAAQLERAAVQLEQVVPGTGL